jgi:sugar lactone lactonase YvrE
MATLTPQVLLDGIVFPECPRWHQGKLWFSDIFAGKVMTVDVEVRAAMIASIPERPSGLGWLPDNRLLIVSMRISVCCARPRRLHWWPMPLPRQGRHQ